MGIMYSEKHRQTQLSDLACFPMGKQTLQSIF